MITIHPENIDAITLNKGSLMGFLEDLEEPEQSKFLKWLNGLFNKKRIRKYVEDYEIKGDGGYYSHSSIRINTNIKWVNDHGENTLFIDHYFTTFKEAKEEFDRLTKQFNQYHNLNK